MGKLLRAVGTMSGTSLDGIDVALIETDGEMVVHRQAFQSTPYDPAFRETLRAALTAAKGLADRTARPGLLADVERELTDRHAAAIRALLAAERLAPADIDLVAFHGQTVLHAPDRGLTVQLGDGERLAASLGIRVVYDLRAADVAAGGQGAPLAPVYHRAMARALGGREPAAILNIGGVANVTFIGAAGDLVACDTGPGNALLDDWMLRMTCAAIDRDGACAASGRVDEAVLDRLLAHHFFWAPPPKSLDRDAFGNDALAGLSAADGAATLVAFTTAAVARAASMASAPPARWIVTGGGRHNRAMMAALGARLGAEVVAAEAAGFDGDAVEAEAWAFLGVRSVKGLAITYPETTGVPREMTGGVVVG